MSLYNRISAPAQLRSLPFMWRHGFQLCSYSINTKGTMVSGWSPQLCNVYRFGIVWDLFWDHCVIVLWFLFVLGWDRSEILFFYSCWPCLGIVSLLHRFGYVFAICWQSLCIFFIYIYIYKNFVILVFWIAECKSMPHVWKSSKYPAHTRTD